MIIRGSVSAFALCLLAACSQGSDIASPGASNPGTPPTDGGSGGGTGGGSTAECPTGFTEGAAVAGFTTCNLTGSYLADLSLPYVEGVAYAIDGRVDIGADVGADGGKSGGTAAKLTVAPGVTVFGRSGGDYIIVNRGSQIIADGNAANPIVFTSANDLVRRAANPDDFGGDNSGEWGGLVLLGQAPINRCVGTATPATVDCENVIEGVSNPDAVYGGADATDNSGILRYVSLRFSGFAIGNGNELNGISLGGVGSGTTIDYVQVHNSSDDGIEFFGGTVNAKHLVLTGNDDDSLDTDNGLSSGIQYVVVQQRTAGGDNMVEASGVSGVSPASNAKVSNFTFVGNNSGNALRLNTGTVGTYVNGVVSNLSECFRWEGSAGNGTAGYQAGADPFFGSVLFDCAAGLATSNSDTAAATASVASDPNNTTTTTNTLSASYFPGPNEAAVTPFNTASLGSFFEPTTYIGAFSPTETETNNWAVGWTFGLFPKPTCPTGTADSGLTISSQTVCRISGTITDDVRLTRGNLYEVVGRLNVGVDVGADGLAATGDPATLTIESGVTVFGGSGADYIVVNRGSKIFANGTKQSPVTMTSEADVTGTQPNAAEAIGEWGGLVILGRAPINRCVGTGTPGTVDCQNVIEGVSNPDAVYGGAEPTDDSGSLRYLVMKHSGFAIATGNELNGISLGGVGTGTEIDYVQVHNSSDDGIEFFGGTVNAKHIVLTGNDDDSLDTDNGYNGSLQYVIVKQRTAGGDNMVEASGVPGKTPQSNAKVSNFTFIGAAGGNALRLNTGTIGTYVNGVVTDTAACMNWERSAGNGVLDYQAGGVDPSFASVLFDCVGGLARTGSDPDPTKNPDADAPGNAVAADANNSTNKPNTLVSTFINGPTETAVTAFDVTGLSSDLDPVTHIGAVKDSNDTWWQGWSCGLEASDPC